MSRRPRLTARKLIAVLRRAGFEIIRVRGSPIFCNTGTGEGLSFRSTLRKP